MKCKNKDIKELLPRYREEELDPDDRIRVEGHLAACADCAAELGLLGVVAAEEVPDPGDAFWSAMPDRVYHALQEEAGKKSAAKRWDLSRLGEAFALPRWAWATASLGIVAAVAWIVLYPGTLPDELGENIALLEEPAYTSPDEAVMAMVDLAELESGELDTVAGWADKELSSMTKQVESTVLSGDNQDVYEEITELDIQELEQLHEMLKNLKAEGARGSG